jgi:multicomponent K+:H+ antiporter subunit G
MTEIVISLLLLIGAAFALIGSIGLARLPDFFMRLHGPTKATTLGIGAIVVASLVHGRTLAPLAITVFLFITAPVTAHVVSKAALKREAKRPPKLD